MKCQRCGSTEQIEGIEIRWYGDSHPVTATVDKRPEALLFKGTVSSPLKGRACGSCGYVELFVTNPRDLLEAAKTRSDE
jgi:hypothetical protein